MKNVTLRQHSYFHACKFEAKFSDILCNFFFIFQVNNSNTTHTLEYIQFIQYFEKRDLIDNHGLFRWFRDCLIPFKAKSNTGRTWSNRQIYQNIMGLNGIAHQFWIYITFFSCPNKRNIFCERSISIKQLWLETIEKIGCSKSVRPSTVIMDWLCSIEMNLLWKMFLSLGHEKNVEYSKLVNNPFNDGQIYHARTIHCTQHQLFPRSVQMCKVNDKWNKRAYWWDQTFTINHS